MLLWLYTAILVLSIGSFLNIMVSVLLNMALAGLWVLLFLQNRKTVTHGQTMLASGFVALFSVLTLANHHSEDLGVLSQILKSLLMIYSIRFFELRLEVFLLWLVRVLLMFSLLSNLVYVLVLVGIPLPMVQVANTNTYMMLNAGYGVDFANQLGLIRNSGVFYEPGLYQLPLSLACIWAIKAGRGRLFWYFWLTLVSTLSVIGLAHASLLMVVYFFRQPALRMILSVLMLVIVLAVSFNDILVFYVAKTQTVSYMLRLGDFHNGLMLFFDRPFLGHGPSFVAQSSFDGVLRGSSNGILGVLHQFGLIAVLVFCLTIVRAVLNGHTLEAIVFFLTLTSQNIFLSNFGLTLFTLLLLSTCKLNRPIEGSRLGLLQPYRKRPAGAEIS